MLRVGICSTERLPAYQPAIGGYPAWLLTSPALLPGEFGQIIWASHQPAHSL